jgi:zinc protease
LALADGFTAEEVEAAKTTFLQDNLPRMSQDAFVAQTLGRYAEFGRSMTRLTETRTKVAALTPAVVNAAFRKWIAPAGFSYFKGGDFKKAGVLQ